MPREIAPEAPVNSTVTPTSCRAEEGARPASHQHFSEVMRAKQETGRLAGRIWLLPGARWSFSGAEVGGQAGKGPTCPEAKPSGQLGARGAGQEGCGESSGAHRDRRRHDPAVGDVPAPPCADPLVRMFARTGSAAPVDAAPPMTLASCWSPEVLRVVKRVAWGGDRDRGTAYIEFGDGALAGAALTIESRSGGVSLILDLPPGLEGTDWERRFEERLARRGLRVDRVLVR